MDTKGLLFRGQLPTSTTIYVQVPVRNNTVGASIHWSDATSSATITLEMTSHPSGKDASGAGTAALWKDSAVTVTGPSAAAIGCSLVNVDNVRQKYARLKIVTAAVSNLEIWDGTA